MPDTDVLLRRTLRTPGRLAGSFRSGATATPAGVLLPDATARAVDTAIAGDPAASDVPLFAGAGGRDRGRGRDQRPSDGGTHSALHGLAAPHRGRAPGPLRGPACGARHWRARGPGRSADRGRGIGRGYGRCRVRVAAGRGHVDWCRDRVGAARPLARRGVRGERAVGRTRGGSHRVRREPPLVQRAGISRPVRTPGSRSRCAAGR